MVQTTDFARIKELDYATSREIYYFDEEGALIDRESTASGALDVLSRRIYAVKLLVSELDVPGTTSQRLEHGWRVLVLMAPFTNPQAMTQFGNVSVINDLADLPKNNVLRTRSIVVARMDAQPR
jgi:hypothetical protein